MSYASLFQAWQNILQFSFSLRGIITVGNLLALLGMQDNLHTKIQTLVHHLWQLMNLCARNPWKTGWERGLTLHRSLCSWWLSLQPKCLWKSITHSKMVWCFRKEITQHKLYWGGSVLSILSKNHLKVVNTKALTLRSWELSHEKVLLALNSLVLCEGVQSMQGREKPKLHERDKRSKSVKKLW